MVLPTYFMTVVLGPTWAYEQRDKLVTLQWSGLRRVYSDTTQLNSTDPVEQRTAKSVVFLFMTSRPTN